MDFEGIIPKGQYGAGKVKIWDKGNYEMSDKKENKMVLNLNGKKLKGEFVLLKFKKAGENSWLFFKKKNKIKNYKSLIVKIPSLVPAGFIFVSIATIYFKLVLSAT